MSRQRASSHVLTVRLRKPLERALREGHPWLFSEAVERHQGAPGQQVRVIDKKGRFVAAGLSEAGPIGVRVFTLKDEPVARALFAARLDAALELRARIVPPETDAYRLLHGEGDRLPGAVLDRYGDAAVLKLDGEAIAAHLPTLLELLAERLPALGVRSLLLRSGRADTKQVELAFGPEPVAERLVRERGMALWVNLYEGQKTGLFLDHRESRATLRGRARGLGVLNLYGYTGGFSVAAGLGGAREVTTVDLARPALDLAARSFAANGLDAVPHRTFAADALEWLGQAKERGERWELIVADPPNFAPRKDAVEGALRAYESLHAAVFAVLAPGGHYLAASCSSHVTRADFEGTLADAARRARRVPQVLERSGAPADHPRLLGFPEGDYLKVLWTRAL
jgi:23S rRNA (cytosine1962-C5)-methyltransferase